MSFAEEVQFPDVKLFYAAEITAGKVLHGFTESASLDYIALTEEYLDDVKVNGVSLTSVADSSTCQSTVNSYAYPGDGKLYVHIEVLGAYVGANDSSLSVVAYPKFYFSSEDIPLNDMFYQGRIKDIPKISFRVENDFSGVGQISGGSMTLINADGFFDARSSYNWDAGKTVLKAGAVRATKYIDGYRMPYADYVTLATWTNKGTQKTDLGFQLNLFESKDKVRRDIPFETYDIETYPAIKDGCQGEPIPIAYGQIYGAKAVCINTATKLFKLCSNAITGIDAVRVSSNSYYDSVVITSIDEANATFIYADWDGESTVTCDFKGKPGTDGFMIENASDIIKDLLAYIGETDIDAASFASAKAYLLNGTRDIGSTAYFRNPSVYVSSVEDAFDVISSITESTMSYLFCGSDGKYNFKVFAPTMGDTLTTITDIDITSFKEKVRDDDKFTSYKIGYSTRIDEGWHQTVTGSNAKKRYERNETKDIQKTKEDSLLYNTDDATRFGERFIEQNGSGIIDYEVTVKAIGLQIGPGDNIHLVYTRHGLDKILEVTSVNKNLTKNQTVLTLSNMRGLEDRSGFWKDATDVLPARFAGETGYGTGSLTWSASWSDTLNNWARQNSGYWTDANGYAEEVERGFKPSVWT